LHCAGAGAGTGACAGACACACALLCIEGTTTTKKKAYMLCNVCKGEEEAKEKIKKKRQKTPRRF
jgi:cobalamin biosynthesis protein CbiD